MNNKSRIPYQRGAKPFLGEGSCIDLSQKAIYVNEKNEQVDPEVIDAPDSKSKP